jgi:hypothetical protein
LKHFTYGLVAVLAQNYKQHNLSPAEVSKVRYSLAELYVIPVYLNLLGCWGMKFVKHFKGEQAVEVWKPVVYRILQTIRSEALFMP